MSNWKKNEKTFSLNSKNERNKKQKRKKEKKKKDKNRKRKTNIFKKTNKRKKRKKNVPNPFYPCGPDRALLVPAAAYPQISGFPAEPLIHSTFLAENYS